MREDYENDKDNSNSINIVKGWEMMIKIIRMRMRMIKVIMLLIVINQTL